MKTRYVYYDKRNGMITDISNEPIENKDTYIECPIDDVIGFLNGTKNMNKYIVAYHFDEKKYMLVKKDNNIKMKSPSGGLYKIPYEKDAISDLTLTYYDDNVLELTLDLTRISPLYQTDFRKDVRFEDGFQIRLVLREKDTDNLLKEIAVSANNVLDSGQMFFELYDHITPDNLEIYTYKFFDTITWCRGDKKLLSPIKSNIKFDVHKAHTKPISKDFEYHLIVKPDDKTLKVTNNIESVKLIRMYNEIDFYVVNKHDPNILYDTFFITKSMLELDEFNIELKCSMEDKSILYNHKFISVLLEG